MPWGFRVCLCSGRLQSPFLSKPAYGSEPAGSPQRQASPVPAGSASPVRATGVSQHTHSSTHTHNSTGTKTTHTVHTHTQNIRFSYLAQGCMLRGSLLFLCITVILNLIMTHASIQCSFLKKLPKIHLCAVTPYVRHAWCLVVVSSLCGLVIVFSFVHACLCLCFGW